jgi:hypothetical protein
MEFPVAPRANWKGVCMRDIDVLVKVILEIELILDEHIEPGHLSNLADTLDRIFAVMDENNATAAAERILAGYGLRVVK